MKITPLITSVRKNMKATSTRVSNAGACGYKIGMRTSKIYNQGRISTALNVGKGVTRKVIQTSSVDDLPYVAGAIGLMTPIPFASPVMLALGAAAKMVIKKLHKP